MSIPAPNAYTAIVHGGAGDDDLVDQANLVPIPAHTNKSVHNTYIYCHEGNATCFG